MAGIGRGIDVDGLEGFGELCDALEPVAKGAADLVPVKNRSVAEGELEAVGEGAVREAQGEELQTSRPG